jgi:hypothetical protein
VKRREHMDRGEWSVKGRRREHMDRGEWSVKGRRKVLKEEQEF